MRTKGQSVYGTYASLIGVRRVQVSTRSSEESQLPSSICGLRFDYHDWYNSSTIIGQWMNEGDAMDFSRDEEVRSVTIWMRMVDRRSTNVGQGRVTAIKIDTTRNRSKTFLCGSSNGCMRHHYQSGTHEYLVGSLAFPAFSWLTKSC